MLHILTLTWNGIHLLRPLHASLMPALEGLDWKWHIKDNGSEDTTVSEIEAWKNDSDGKSGIIPYAYPNNRQTFAEGMNYLFDKAKADPEDHILLLNNDVEIKDHDSIRNMIAAMTDDVGAVGARLVFTGTNKIQHGGVIFTENHALPIHFRANEESDERAEQNRYFQAVTGAVVMTKAKYYDKICQDNKSGINGLDEKYVWMYEDIDACLAIAAMGKKIVYCGKTNISHRESATLKENPVNKLFFTPNIQRFRSKWHGKYIIDEKIYKTTPDRGLIK